MKAGFATIASVVLCAFTVMGCAGPASVPSSEQWARNELAGCRASLARVEELRTIEGFVRHVNRLPRPATVPCLLASLPRPLDVVAATSATSAQPSVHPRSPRLFLMLPGLVVTVVAEGNGERLVEFGEFIDVRRTVKGELELPLAESLDDSAAFRRVVYGTENRTTCGFCHREEEAVPGRAGAYSSLAYRPDTRLLVPFEQVRMAPSEACAGDGGTSSRCLFWRSLLDYGEVRAGAFDPTTPTIF